MVIAFIFAQCPVFHPLFHTAVPAGSWTMSPSLAALIASQTASGVNPATMRVSARTAVGSEPSAATRKHAANNNGIRVFLVFIVKNTATPPGLGKWH